MPHNYSEEHLAAIKKAGFSSMAAAGELSRAELEATLEADTPVEEVESLFDDAHEALDNALLMEKKVLTHASPLLPDTIRQAPERDTLGFVQRFGERAVRYAAPGDIASRFSPAAYLVHLYHHARDLYPEDNPYHIDIRRPGLKDLVLSQDNLDTPQSALNLSNAILSSKAASLDGGDEDGLLRKLANELGSGCLPYHHHYSRLGAVFAGKDPELLHLRAAPRVMQHLTRSSLASIRYDIPPALRSFLIDPINEANAQEKFAKYFPGAHAEAMMHPSHLRAWSGLSDAELQGFMGALDRSEYVGNTLVTRVGDKFFNLRIVQVQGYKQLEWLRFYPTGDNRWTLSVKFSGGSKSLRKFNLEKFDEVPATPVSFRAGDRGDKDFIVGKEYKTYFEYDYDRLPAEFTVETTRSAYGWVTYKHRINLERLSPALYLLRLQKLIRLHKATQLPRRVLEDIIDSVEPGQITDHTLAVLFQAAQAVQEYGISHEDALVMARGNISTSDRQGETSQFDRLFNKPALMPEGFILDDQLVPLNPAQGSEHGAALATLRRACQVDEEGLYELGRCLAADEGKNVKVRSRITQISRLYTLSLWARLHGLRPSELRQLLTLVGLPRQLYRESADTWLQLLQGLSTAVKWLAARNWTVHDLHLMTRSVAGIAASTEIRNLQRDMKAALEAINLPDTLSAEMRYDVYARALVPVIASVFNLSAETAARALLRWADQGKPGGIDLIRASDVLRRATPGSDQANLTAFIYGLAQRALIVHACGVSPDVLAMLVREPTRLTGATSGSQRPGTTLDLSLRTLMALGDFSDWLKRLPDPEGASGALLTALAGDQGVARDMLAGAAGLPPVALSQAAAQAHQRGDIGDPNRLSHWLEIDALHQWITLASAWDVMPSTLGALLDLEFVDATDSKASWESWAKVAGDFTAGLSPSQKVQVQAALHAPISNALSGFIAAREGLTRDRFDQYLLLDSANGSQVVTSRVAEATAAVQTFIHRCLTQPEDSPGLRTAVLDRQFFRDWTRWNARYATWAAGQMLMYYPENYIDPTVRLGQTNAMDEMLQALGQAQINADTVGDAFRGYLTAFEQVANLETISGYHDNRDVKAGKSWFLGRSRGVEGEYWWRTVDEAKRAADGTLPANAWSSWTKIDLAIQATGKLIRPVVFRERLYLGWVERQEQVISRDNHGKPLHTAVEWSFKLAWRRYDGNWSAPQNYPFKLQNDVDVQRLALFLVARSGRDSLVMGTYDRAAPEASKQVHAGLEIFDDLQGSAVEMQPFLVQVPHWLDSATHTGMCAVFDGRGQPVVEKRISPAQASKVPPEFMRFEAVLKQVKLEFPDPDNRNRYNLVLDTVLTVDAKRAERPNKWATVLVSYFSELATETQTIPMMLRGKHGAAMLRRVDSRYWIYLCVSAERFKALVPDQGVTAIRSSQEKAVSSQVEKVSTPSGEFYIAKFSAPHQMPFAMYYFQFLVGKRVLPTYWDLQRLIDQPSAVVHPYISPLEYVNDPGRVNAEDVHCTVYDAASKRAQVSTAARHFDLAEGPHHIPFSMSVELGDTEDWKTDEAIHVIRYQCGRGSTRDYQIRVYRDADTLRTAVIGTSANGAQYLEREGWVTRLNTLFARQLTEKAVAGLDAVLSYDTQQLPEPAIGVVVQLTLPTYQAAYHGSNRSAQVWLAKSATDRTLLWNGTLDERDLTPLELTFAHGATFGKTGHYYLQTRYQKVNHKRDSESLIIDAATLKVQQSSDVAPRDKSKLDKRNIHSVNVMPRSATTPMDFSGANALYFWELFYYAPMMVMQRFLQEERFDMAERWLKYVFNPIGYYSQGKHTPRMWNVRPLQEDRSWNDAPLRAIDPDAVAQNDPMHYKVHVFMRLLDIVIGRGDVAYRKLERDSLAQAKVSYQHALDLLGDAPWTPPATGWDEPLLGQLASKQAFESHLAALEQLDTDSQSNAGRQSTSSLFLPEANRAMLAYWETLRLRLYNLRNNLTLDGQPLNLPLFAERADPKAMLAAAVAAQAGGEGPLPEINGVPALRFTHLLDGARTMVGQLIQFGSTMQGILERQDAEALASLLTTQGAELAKSNVALFQQRLNELTAERVTLQKSLETATLRRDHYQALYQEDISGREMHALNLQTTAGATAAGGSLLMAASAMFDIAPNVYGLANGGHKLSAPLKAASHGADVYAKIQTIAASRIGQEEAYRRRRNDWSYQCKTAEKDMAMIQAQLDALTVRETSAQMHLAHLGTQSAHAEAQLALHHGKFTGKAMYSWLRARLASIFYTYYDLAVTRCVMAQKALQWEIGDTTTYLRTGTWNGAWAGLLCGEGLMLSLGQMDNAWTQWQKRELEVTRTVSLAKHMSGKLKVGKKVVNLGEAVQALITGKTVDVDASLALCSLTMSGEGTLSIQVGLKSLNLAAGFEQSRSRRIRSIAVTLPGLMGPYQDVHGRLKTNAKGLPVGCDECAISHAIKDYGLFSELNGYPPLRPGIQLLPFEGLHIPKARDDDETLLALNLQHANGDQKALLQSLNDIILHVQFTAR